MNIMTGYLAATEGQVLVDGHAYWRSRRRPRPASAICRSSPPLYLDMTVEEYLRFCAELKRIPKGERTAS